MEIQKIVDSEKDVIRCYLYVLIKFKEKNNDLYPQYVNR